MCWLWCVWCAHCGCLQVFDKGEKRLRKITGSLLLMGFSVLVILVWSAMAMLIKYTLNKSHKIGWLIGATRLPD